MRRHHWDWLADLVARASRDGRTEALAHALGGLGFAPGEMVGGIAHVLGVSPRAVVEPHASALADTDPTTLAIVLRRLLDHEDSLMRRIGERWLALPSCAFHLPRPEVERWLFEEGSAARILAPRLSREGLAWLGPTPLRRLAAEARSETVRAAAHGWLARLGRIAVALALSLALVGLCACRRTQPPGAGGGVDATAMGHWDAWGDLTPLVEVAQHHAPKPTVQALREASALLRQGKARSADGRLSDAADTAGHGWIAVARADLAALHFTLCIRGVAWRLQDGATPNATDRKMDFSEDTRIEPGDISVEALLTNLDAAAVSEEPALATQARIARARVAAFAQRCPPNDEVEQMAQRMLENDLATLAAEGHLTPDLAYLWAGVQMSRFSGTAARPFLVQAREGGFDHPAVTFMLAVIALEERDLKRADELALQAGRQFAAVNDKQNVAESAFVRGEIARARKDATGARKHYQTALQDSPTHVPAMLGIATIVLSNRDESAAVEYLHGQLPKLLGKGTLDAGTAREAAINAEALAVLATDPHVAQLSRDALLHAIENEPEAMRRGIRYFFAATLDARLREYELARGHGVLAKEEFAETGIQPPVDVEAFLQRLGES